MKCFAILLVLLLLLTGCAVAPAQESTAPSTTLPAKTEPSTAPGTAPAAPGDLPPTLPWSVPEAEPLSYEDYFAQVRAFDGPYGVETDFTLETEGNRLYVTQRSTNATFLIGKSDDYGYLVDGKDPLDWDLRCRENVRHPGGQAGVLRLSFPGTDRSL